MLDGRSSSLSCPSMTSFLFPSALGESRLKKIDVISISAACCISFDDRIPGWSGIGLDQHVDVVYPRMKVLVAIASAIFDAAFVRNRDARSGSSIGHGARFPPAQTTSVCSKLNLTETINVTKSAGAV